MTPSAPKRPLLKLAAAAGLALSLCGCISVFPKSQPAQLYRFGVTPAARFRERRLGALRVMASP